MFDILTLVKILGISGIKYKDEERLIKVRFPNFTGDQSRTMTIQQLKEEYKDYLIIDPSVGEQIDIEKLANIEDVEEVVAMPPIQGG